MGHGEGGVDGVEDASGVVDMAAGDCHRHGRRLAARGGGGDGEFAVQRRMGMMGFVEVLAMAKAHYRAPKTEMMISSSFLLC